MKKIFLLTLGVLFFCLTTPAQAYLYHGTFSKWQAGTSESFGDGVNQISTEWNWIFNQYGEGYFNSLAEMYTFHSLTDPTTVSDASALDWALGYGNCGGELFCRNEFSVGDTVFFRSAGKYGAIAIDKIDLDPDVRWYMDARWYYQSDGTGDLRTVPEPMTMLLFGTGMAGAFIRRKFS